MYIYIHTNIMIQETTNKPIDFLQALPERKKKGLTYNILSVRAGNLLKKLTGAGGNLPLNLGCLIR